MHIKDPEYACFISYCHGQGELVSEYINFIKKTLDDHLAFFLDQKVFCDMDRLKPGYRYNEALAKAICKSLCMVVVYYPRYVRKDYCRREFRAMQILEMKRREILGDNIPHDIGMIIPIILQGNIEKLPVCIQDQIHCCDLTKPMHPTISDFENDPNTIAKLKEIAEYINELYDIVENCGEDIFEDCRSFRLPRINEVSSLEESVPTKDPYAGSWGNSNAR
jgi:hypothetical protein